MTATATTYDYGTADTSGGRSVTIERSRLYPSRPRSGPAWTWYYEAVGPDGARFNNTSLVELRRVLRRKYGRAVAIVEPWKAAA